MSLIGPTGNFFFQFPIKKKKRSKIFSFSLTKKKLEEKKERNCGRPSSHNFGHPLDRKQTFFKGGLSIPGALFTKATLRNNFGSCQPSGYMYSGFREFSFFPRIFPIFSTQSSFFKDSPPPPILPTGYNSRHAVDRKQTIFKAGPMWPSYRASLPYVMTGPALH